MIRDNSSQHQTELVADVCRYLRELHPESVSLPELGARFHISPYHLQRIFKRATGISPREYAANLRLEDFKAHIREGERITDAIFDAGYSSSSRLYEQSDAKLGMTPTAYRKGGAGMTIFYSAVPCPLGYLLVAVTERGICKLSLGDAPAPLIADLESEFDRAERIPDDEGVGYWVEQIIAYLEGWQPDLELPLDLRATAFQLKVWGELQAIPVGETRSYSEVAAAIGQPTASPRRRQRLRQKSGRPCHPLPSHHPSGQAPRWLPLGNRTQARHPRARAAISPAGPAIAQGRRSHLISPQRIGGNTENTEK